MKDDEVIKLILNDRLLNFGSRQNAMKLSHLKIISEAQRDRVLALLNEITYNGKR